MKFEMKLDRRKLALISWALHAYVKDAQRTTDEDERTLWKQNDPEDRTASPKTWRDLEAATVIIHGLLCFFIMSSPLVCL